MAIQNNTTGTVEETREAIMNQDIKCIHKIILPIQHCLYKKKNVTNKELKQVASHKQALKQTEMVRKLKYKELQEIELEDTALGANELNNNILHNTTAVICSQIAGELYHLELVDKDLNDNQDNKTTFGVFINNSKKKCEK